MGLSSPTPWCPSPMPPPFLSWRIALSRLISGSPIAPAHRQFSFASSGTWRPGREDRPPPSYAAAYAADRRRAPSDFDRRRAPGDGADDRRSSYADDRRAPRDSFSDRRRAPSDYSSDRRRAPSGDAPPYRRRVASEFAADHGRAQASFDADRSPYDADARRSSGSSLSRPLSSSRRAPYGSPSYGFPSSAPRSRAQPPSAPGLGVPLSGGDRGIARELRRAGSALEVLRHYESQRREYDGVALATALASVLRLSAGVKPWKRAALPRGPMNALVADTVDALRSAIGGLQAGTRALGGGGGEGGGGGGAGARRAPPPEVLPRTLASMAWCLAKVDRAPPSVLGELSTALLARLDAAGGAGAGARGGGGAPPWALAPADLVQLTYAFSRANVPAPRLFNRLAGEAAAALRGARAGERAPRDGRRGEEALGLYSAPGSQELSLEPPGGGGGAESDSDGRPPPPPRRLPQAARAALRELRRPLAPRELASVLLSFTSLRTMAPGLFAEAAGAVGGMVAADAEGAARGGAARGGEAQRWGHDRAPRAEPPSPPALSAQVASNLAVAFARALSAAPAPPSALAGGPSPGAPGGAPRATAAAHQAPPMRGLGALAPVLARLAAAGRVPVVQPEAFTAQVRGACVCWGAGTCGGGGAPTRAPARSARAWEAPAAHTVVIIS